MTTPIHYPEERRYYHCRGISYLTLTHILLAMLALLGLCYPRCDRERERERRCYPGGVTP